MAESTKVETLVVEEDTRSNPSEEKRADGEVKREGKKREQAQKRREDQPRNQEPQEPQVKKSAKAWARENSLVWEAMDPEFQQIFIDFAKERGGPGPGAQGAPGIPPIPGNVVRAILSKVESQLNEPRVEELIRNPKARDEYFNSIFELVDASPHEFFQQAFTFENQISLTRFMNIIMNASREQRLSPVQRNRLKADFDRYLVERRIREGSHNVNAILYIPSVKAEQLFEHLQSIESLLGDAAHQLPGVVDMANILERVLREEMRNNDGYLRPEAITGVVDPRPVQKVDQNGLPVFDAQGNPIYDDVLIQVQIGEVERRAKEIFMQNVSRNDGVFRRNVNGQVELIHKDFQNRPWEVDRVFATARAVMIMSERLLSIAAEGKLGEGTAHYGSLFLQDILQGYSAIIHGLGKFGFTEEAAAIFLQDPDEKVKKVFGLLSLWNPKKSEEAYKTFHDTPKAILESDNEFFALQKQNPNKVGDMMTLQAWRFIENPDEPSAVQRMVRAGRERMKEQNLPNNPHFSRWNVHHPGDPTFDVYEEFLNRTQFRVPRNATKKEKDKRLNERKAAWAAFHPGAPSIEDYEKYANEYFKWIGTAVRFDTLRTELDKLSKPDKGASSAQVIHLWEEQIDKARQKWRKSGKYEDRERFEKLENADKIIGRMVKLQPHRLYDKSPDMEKRINAQLFAFLGFPPDKAHHTPDQKARVQKILDNFYWMENVLHNERERLLDWVDPAHPNRDKTYDSDILSLDEFLARPGMFVDDPALGLNAATQRLQATEFRNIFVNDYNTNKDKYLIELIYRRNYKHGFVLWTGDVPLDEYRLTALGPSGSFVRRARDNKTTGEGTTELFKFMGKLPEFQSLEQMIPFLKVIYDKHAIYSADRAKEIIADISLGIAKFVAERPTTSIPGWGFFERAFLKPSFAKIVYGEKGLSASPTEIRDFFDTLYKHHHMITEKKYIEITRDKVPGNTLDVMVDVGSTMSQLIALAILLYFLTELFKKKR